MGINVCIKGKSFKDDDFDLLSSMSPEELRQHADMLKFIKKFPKTMKKLA